jgi:Ca2+-binding EF-hand superfamily protein
LVPGFGVEPKKQTVPGFGGTMKPTSAISAASAADGDASNSTETPANSPDQVDSSIRKFAKSILKQNDKNGNDILEKSEWAELRDAELIDKDHNGVITLEELTAYYQAKNGIRSPRKTNHGNSAAASNPADASLKTGKTYRILSPTERLPEGLPDWFRNDANGDGQISMPEFSHDWTTEQAAKFARYDLNGDGIITPQEVLQVDKKK